jgi:hypothetical protein
MTPYDAPHGREGREEAWAFLETLFATLKVEQKIEVRCKPSGEDGRMRRRFFANPREALSAVLELRDAHDVYVGAAPRRGEIGTRDGITESPALWADLDPKDGHTRQSRLEQLMGLPLHPSIMVWTGGGWHAYWLLEEPAEGREALERAEAVMRRLGEGLGGDPVHDLPRILRVPGTRNHKYENPRPVMLVRCDPDRRYALAQLEEMAQALPRRKDGSGGIGGGNVVPRDVLAAPVRETRNVVLASVGGSLRDRGLDEATIGVVLLEVNRLRCEPPLGEPEVRRIAGSVSRYSAGSPRYRGSPARRLYRDGKAAR